jgi:pyruvate formate lyase activating enzyme
MTTSYSAADLIDIIRENQPFISGITLSGGEATVQLPFIIDFLAMLRADPELSSVNCLLDTNGSLGIEGWNSLLPYLDGVMLDLKSWHSDRHKILTGASNDKVKRSLKLLAAAKKLVEVRLLVIPDQSDYDEYLEAICAVLGNLPAETTVRINAFHHHGVRGVAREWPNASCEEIEGFAQQLRQEGINNLVLPPVYLENLQGNNTVG